MPLTMKIEDIHGNGYLVVEPEPLQPFKIEAARCEHCGTKPIVVHRVDPIGRRTIGDLVLCECGEKFGAAYLRTGTIITNQEAWVEAMRRWGDFGHVAKRESENGWIYQVGATYKTAPEQNVYGEGRNWDEAFADAKVTAR